MSISRSLFSLLELQYGFFYSPVKNNINMINFRISTLTEYSIHYK